mgnify:CR=1 FL=1|tara:strand:+ start:33375 stop:34628 length:1254 start_codon:yes stop_codon:yes gene_type:complete
MFFKLRPLHLYCILLAFLFLPQETSAQINLSNGLVAHFTFDGNALDSSPLGINGTVNNATLTPGINSNADSAYFFNGLDAYVDCDTNNRGISNQLSISVWVKTTMLNIGWVVGKYDWHVDKGFAIQIKDGQPFVSGRNGNNQYFSTFRTHATILVNDGNWHHLTAIMNGNSWSMYTDCQLDTTITAGTSLSALDNPEPLAIGYYPLGGGTFNHNYFEGAIDEVRIYNRTLTADELQTLCKKDIISSVLLAPTPPKNDTLCKGTTHTFQAQADSGVVIWIDSLGTVLDSGLAFTTVISANVTYYLCANANGMHSDTVSFQIIAKDCIEPIFPTIFTPNGDGVNDYFYITIPYVTCFDLVVYNRWGMEVFKTSTPEYPWDGRVVATGAPLPAGVYYYSVSYCLDNGKTETKNKTITILR